MAEVFSGFVVGYALALIVAPVVALMLLRQNAPSAARAVAPEGTNVVALSVVVHFAAMIVLTAVGLVLGMVLMALNDRRPDGGLGSPNVIYTTIVVLAAVVVVVPLLALPALRRYAVLAGAVFAGMFGWAMPWLATLA